MRCVHCKCHLIYVEGTGLINVHCTGKSASKHLIRVRFLVKSYTIRNINRVFSCDQHMATIA